jgi:hypothetical protein
MYYNPSDLASALEKNERMRANSAGVVWNPDAGQANSAIRLNENRSYEATAANERADLQVGAVAPKSIMQTLTTSFSENSPWAPF